MILYLKCGVIMKKVMQFVADFSFNSQFFLPLCMVACIVKNLMHSCSKVTGHVLDV